MNTDQRSTIEPENTPLFIGLGVQFAGTIRHNGPQQEKAVILGEFTGDVEWNGVLQVPRGGKVIVEKSMRCREMMVGGEIVGANDEVVIETGLLRLGESASIDVATVSVPPGGLEQSRGSVVNARLRMSKDNAFAQREEQGTAAPAAAAPGASMPTLSLVASGAPAAAEEGGEGSGFVQVETRGQSAAYGS